MKKIFQVISGLFSFETLFVLYLFAGEYKKEEIIKQYLNPSFDLTAILFVASLAVGLFLLFTYKFEITRQSYILLCVFLLFVCYTALSLSWSISSEYGATKTMYLGFLNFWNLIAAAIIIVPDPHRVRRLMFGVLLVSLIYAAISFTIIMRSGTEQKINFTSTDYSGIALVICAGISVLVCYMIDPSQKKFNRLSSFGLCCVYFIILLFVGHRGLLISTVFAMLALLFINPKDSTSAKNNIIIKKGYIIIMLVTVVGVVAILGLSGDEPVTVHRLLLLTDPGQHSSQFARLQYYKQAFHIWSENPVFGSGIGSFPITMGWGDIRGYPHNIILEILSELGLVGLLIFGLLLFFGVRMLLKNFVANSPLSFFVFLLFVTSFVEAFFSSDISDHRLLILSLGLMMFPHEKNQTSDVSQANVPILPGVRQVAQRTSYLAQ